MEEPKDKRTKAYKEWKRNLEKETSIGLGDVVENITNATGIKKLVKTFTPDGKDCGCDKRKEKLNKIRFNHRPVRCFTELQFNQWTDFRNTENKNSVTTKWQKQVLIPIYAQLFAIKLKPLSCCVTPYINNINRVYETYV